MRARKQQTSLRRRQIAQAALALISTRGIRGLSMAGLARRVGLTPSATYRHYTGRDQVLDAALDYIHDHFLANVALSRATSDDAVLCLHDLARRHAQFFMENLAIPRIVFSEEASEGHPERRARIHRMLREYLDAISELVRQGQTEGRITERIDSGTAALLLLGLIMPAGILRHLSGGSFDVMAHLERVWPTYERALRREPVQATPPDTEPREFRRGRGRQ